MKVSTLLAATKTTFSFEFSPPRSEQASEELFLTLQELIPLEPSFVSITYGAGGSTREITRSLVSRLVKQTSLNVVSHLTCVNATRPEVRDIVASWREEGVENIMALRGDPPKGSGAFVPTENGFATGAELVGFLKKEFPELCVGVAGYPEGHPETRNRLHEMDYLKMKVDQGADYICTQLFFDNHDFYDFCDRCELAGIRVPIIAGIMPIISRKNLLRMADLAAGARYPARLLRALSRVEDDEGFEKVGIHWATQQVLDLLDKGVKGIHFYTLNKSRATASIYRSLGVSKSSSLR